jgi:hypothetical protein
MTSSYRDPNITAALAYQAEQEQRRKAQEQPSFLDIAGRTALGLGTAALAGVGIARGLRRNDDRFDLNKYRQAARPIVTQNLSANAEETVRRAARATTTPPPSRPAPPAGVARQQAAEEFTRQARAERPVGVSQVNIQDLIEPSFALPQEPLTGTPYSVSEVINLANQTKTKSPQVAERVASTVKLLPPARAQSTDFLRNQLGSRGYIEQSILDRVAEQSAGDLIDEVTAFSNKEARSELARQGASIQSQQRKNLWNLVSEIQNETLVDTQQARTGFNVDQAINALDAAEDQQTGRMKIQLQRNEDLDMSQVEVLEDIASQQRNSMLEMDEPINMVASQLPDGLPVDQAEGRLIPGDEGYEDRLLKTIYQQELEARPPALTKEDMERNIQNSLNRGLSVQLPSKLPAEGASDAAQEFVSNALNKQRPSRTPLSDIDNKMYDLVATAAESGLKLEPKRALSILTDPNLELTTDEVNLFSINPQIGKFALKGQGYAPGQKQTGGMLSLKGDLLQSIPNIGSDPQSSITQAASGTSIRGRSRVQNQPDEFRKRLDSLGRPIREDVASVDPGGTLTMSTGEELTELDMPEEVTANYRRLTRNPITGQMQEEYAPKGMRAISTAEGKTYYVPIQDPGGVGVYGEERSYASGPTIKFDMPEQGRVAGAYTKAATRRPTDMPFTERTQGGSRFTGLNNDQLNAFIENAPEGKVREAGMRELAGRQGLQISEALRRGNIEGRDPQMILRQFGIGT